LDHGTPVPPVDEEDDEPELILRRSRPVVKACAYGIPAKTEGGYERKQRAEMLRAADRRRADMLNC
jgi:hypothetical protein